MKKFIKENWLLIFAIIYLLSPIDLIPDIIPLFGMGDDASLVIIELIRRIITNKNKKSSSKEIIEGEIVNK
jgi:uncharacterized membrane protein YkvA (DUF1232 family)